MGKLNNSLNAILESHISPITQTSVVLNSEQEVADYIRKNGMFNLDGCEINFKLNIKSILQYLTEEEINITDIRIVNSILRNGVSFYDVQIRGNLYFWENKCGKCDFSNMTVGGFSYFSNTVFESTVSFDHAICKRDCFFWGTEFLDFGYLRNCEFEGRLDFWNAAFYKRLI